MSNKNSKWYLVQVISNYEMKVKDQLENRVMVGDDEIEQIYVPMKEVISEKTGKSRQKPLFPGYIFVKVDMTDDSWFIIRNTQYVTGIVGSSGQRTKPTPIPESEIQKMIDRKTNVERIYDNIPFSVGEHVKVGAGPYASHDGPIVEIKKEEGLIYIETEFLGKKTKIPVQVGDINKQ